MSRIPTVRPGLTVDPRRGEIALEKLAAALLRLPPEAAFSGLSAAWLHGLDVEPCDPIEVTIPKAAGVSGRAGLAVRQSPLEVVEAVDGMRVTPPIRTVGEICSRLGLVDAVVIADMALHAGLVNIAELKSWTTAHAGHRGIKTFRRVVEFAEPAAESPMESRLRMVLVLGGLPRPQAQIEVFDLHGEFAGRTDLYYPDCNLGIEYDGGIHRNNLVDDNRRQNRLLNAGVSLLRFTAADVFGRPRSVVAQVAAQLASSPGTRATGARTKRVSPGTRV